MNPLLGLPEEQTPPLLATSAPLSPSLVSAAGASSPVNLSDTMSTQLPNKYFRLMLAGLAIVSAVEIAVIHDFGTCIYVIPITWFIPSLLWALKDTALASAKTKMIIKDLMTNYGFSLSGSRPANVNDGSLNLYAGTKTISNIMSANYKQREIIVFRFSWYYGRNASGGFPVMKLTLNGDFPPLLVQSKYLDPELMVIANARQINPGLTEEMNLEGDFNQFFNVFTKPDYDVACLEVLTPDVMEYIEDNARPYTFEFVKNDLYMYDYSFGTVNQALAGCDLMVGLASKIKTSILTPASDNEDKSQKYNDRME